ncbi:MAG: hypothetical protein M3R50_11965 [Bacteroidota bacterium]|nr:hypothetical protein [Bacteroidota bacterium]
MLKYGVPESLANGIVDLYRSIHNGKMGKDYDKNKPELGKTKLEDFAKEFAASYNGLKLKTINYDTHQL